MRRFNSQRDKTTKRFPSLWRYSRSHQRAAGSSAMTSELTSPCSCAPHSETRVRAHERAPELSRRKKKRKKKTMKCCAPPSRPRGLFACYAGGGAEQDTLTAPTSHHPTRGRKSEDGWRGNCSDRRRLQGGQTQRGGGRRLERRERKCLFHS